MKHLLPILTPCLLCLTLNAQYILNNSTAGKRFQEAIPASQFVLLGESDHLVKQFNEFKDSLVIQMLNTNKQAVLVFESGICELFCQVLNTKTTHPVGIRTCLFPIWSVKENQPLFDFLNSNAFTIVGIDLQSYNYRYSSLADSLLKQAKICSDFFHMDSILVRLSLKKQMLTLKNSDLNFPKEKLLAYYSDLMKKLQANPGLMSSELDPFHTALFIETLRNRIDLCTEITLMQYNDFMTFRDSIMFRNLKWFADNMAPGTQFIVWAYNGHIAKTNVNHEHFKCVGTYLQDAYPGKAVVVGLLYAKKKGDGLHSLFETDRHVRKAFKGFESNEKMLFSGNPAPDRDAEHFHKQFDYVVLFRHTEMPTYVKWE